MPLWKSESGKEIIIGSYQDFTQYTKQVVQEDSVWYFLGQDNKKVPLSAHRDICDQIILEKDGEKYYRIPEVLDSWMDAGSVPFAEYHYPFENEESYKKLVPADYIVEYIPQVRAWFNVLLRISTMLFDKSAFTNVICTGTLGGNDGRKMSKTFNNYPDPKDVLENIGGDSVRLYMMGSPLMSGEDAYWSDDLLKQQTQTVLIPLQNIANYFVIYADKYNFQPTNKVPQPKHILNQWILAKLADFIASFDNYLGTYHIPEAVRLVQPFLNDLSAWYIRRCRDEFNEGSQEHLETLYYVLKNTTLALAPLVPFITETIFQNILKDTDSETSAESIHLMDFPQFKASNQEAMFAQMQQVQDICTLIHEQRQQASLKIRQPLASVVVHAKELPAEFVEIIKSETNLKQVVFKDPADKLSVELDTKLTPELIEEGEYRDLLREVQSLRKKQGLELNDKITIQAPSWPQSFESQLLAKTLANSISKGDILTVEKVQ